MAEPIKVMIIDDSLVIRRILEKILGDTSKFEIVAQAVDGLDAVTKLKNPDLANKVEIIILDIEMPRMDGLTALPKLLDLAKDAKVLMASTLTKKNAGISLQALDLGASDYLTKPSVSDQNSEFESFSRDLRVKIKILGLTTRRLKAAKNRTTTSTAVPAVATAKKEIILAPKSIARPLALAIGSSTGGPEALGKVITNLDPAKLNIPIFITQHMPPHFTTMLAENLNKKAKLTCVEAKDGQVAEANTVYIAPGDFHMEIKAVDGKKVISLNQNPQENFCRPAADPMIRSLSSAYSQNLLVCILTGMGQDGMKGSMIAKASGATVISQNEETSVVWGMPAAVSEAGICSYVEPIDNIANTIMGITS